MTDGERRPALRPCPFCGGEARVRVSLRGDSTAVGRASCARCGAATAPAASERVQRREGGAWRDVTGEVAAGYAAARWNERKGEGR